MQWLQHLWRTCPELFVLKLFKTVEKDCGEENKNRKTVTERKKNKKRINLIPETPLSHHLAFPLVPGFSSVGQRAESLPCLPHSNSQAEFSVWHPVSHRRCSRTTARSSRLQRIPATVQEAHRHQLTLCSPFRSFRDLWETPFLDGLSKRVGPAPLRRVRLPLATNQLSFGKQSILHMQGTCSIPPSHCVKKVEMKSLTWFQDFFLKNPNAHISQMSTVEAKPSQLNKS